MKLLKNLISANKKILIEKNNFIYFLILVFLFISSSAMAISRDIRTVHRSPFTVHNSKIFPPLPILGKNTSYPVLSAQGVYALDLDSGISLYEKNPDAPLLPASTTKIITSLVAMDTFKLDTVFTSGNEIKVEGQKMGLFVGEKMKFENLLYGLLVYSANDAAETLAYNYPDGYSAFISAMNVKAQELSMTNTHFDNPVGLDSNGQRSTARDLVRASEVAIRNPIFAKIVNTKQKAVSDVSGKFSHEIKNVNELLGTVPGVMGIKTGWTESARENLVTYINRDDHKIIIAILGSTDRFGETKELIDWIYSNYKWQEVKI